ncbi:hypothetical protein HYALB_00002702 [Hymenoscyphus albidus]|uniref:SRR1-like domain-containing protein n=1 Tax=Hymenoscyphus albidus TaxID=595503 RepID=A0A9N9QD87_9HELO|nr:hypothetical protein HYALB_00002702 [Hymenoscyphus albidus]
MKLQEHLQALRKFLCTPILTLKHIMNSDHATSEKNPELTAAHADIRSEYESNHCMFEREIIQDVGMQLKRLNGQSGTVILTDIKSKTIEHEAKVGIVTSPSNKYPSHGEIRTTPGIRYRPIQSLLTDKDIPAGLAYHSLEVLQYHHYYDKSTNKALDPTTLEPLKVNSTQSLKETRKLFKSYQQTWKTTQTYALLKEKVEKGELRDIKKIHALLSTLRKVLDKNKEKYTYEVLCYAQDPAYDNVDKVLLEENEIKVLDDPEGFLEVGDHTIVVSFCADVCVKQIILDIACPAAIISDRFINHPDDSPTLMKVPCSVCFPSRYTGLLRRLTFTSKEPGSSRTAKIISDEYDIHEFPDCTENFTDGVLYIRRESAKSLQERRKQGLWYYNPIDGTRNTN